MRGSTPVYRSPACGRHRLNAAHGGPFPALPLPGALPAGSRQTRSQPLRALSGTFPAGTLPVPRGISSYDSVADEVTFVKRVSEAFARVDRRELSTAWKLVDHTYFPNDMPVEFLQSFRRDPELLMTLIANLMDIKLPAIRFIHLEPCHITFMVIVILYIPP